MLLACTLTCPAGNQEHINDTLYPPSLPGFPKGKIKYLVQDSPIYLVLPSGSPPDHYKHCFMVRFF